MRTFFSVLAALLVFAVIVAGVMSLRAPSNQDCLEQEVAAAITPTMDVDDRC